MDWIKINRIHDQMVSAVQSEDGNEWKASASELHAQYHEIPFWILLFDDRDINEAHRKFRDIISPFFSDIIPVQCTVSYTLLTDTKDIQVDFLNDNQEILAAPENKLLGDYPISMARGDNALFGGLISKR